MTLKIISCLFHKNRKQLTRNDSIKALVFWSHFFIFIALYLMWLSTKGATLKYSSNNVYTPMQFDVECFPDQKDPLESTHFHCDPTQQSYDEDGNNQEKGEFVGELSPASILLNFIDSGSLIGTTSTSKNDGRIAGLISSIMMNGMPLLSFEDYIQFSDFACRHIGNPAKEKMMEFSSNREKFGNLLYLRSRSLRFASKNQLTKSFIDYLYTSSDSVKGIKVETYENMNLAMADCCDNLFAVIEILEPVNYYWNSTYIFNSSDRSTSDSSSSRLRRDISSLCFGTDPSLPPPRSCSAASFFPEVTIRMHPSSIPDTRSFQWSPRKSGAPKYSSGQLLYFLSGFLSLQFELQNYFAEAGFGGQSIQSHNLRNSILFPDPTALVEDIAQRLVESTSIMKHNNNTSDINSSSNNHNNDKYNNQNHRLNSEKGGEFLFSNCSGDENYSLKRDVVDVPLYHRAYPTHKYTQNKYWHSFGLIIAIVLIIFFSIPAAITSGYFSHELQNGQIDSLSTIGVYNYHSAISWAITCIIWTLASSIIAFIYFSIVLNHTSPLLPTLALFMLGCSSSPLSLIFSIFIKRADTLVIAVPTFVFILTLPGMLYFDIAYDVQRSVFVESILSLIFPSGSALVLREIFSIEAMEMRVTLDYKSPISHTPLYLHFIILAFDLLILCAAGILVVHFNQDIKTHAFVQYPVTKSKVQSILVVIERRSQYFIQQLFNFFGISSSFNSNIPGNGRNSDFSGKSNSSSNCVPVYSTNSESSSASTSNDSKSGHTFLRVSNLYKEYYGSRGSAIEVLNNVSTQIRSGNVYALIGSNGCGKSTFMRILGGFDTNYDGTLHSSSSSSSPPNASNYFRKIGWCPQNDPLYSHLTVREHLNLFSELINLAFGNLNSVTSAEIDDLLDSVDMTGNSEKYALALSGGMKRRLSLSMALLGKPPILLLDEPSSGCDSWTRELIRKEIISRKSNSAILVSTHHLVDVEILGDQIIFLNDRNIDFCGSVSELFDRADSVGSKQHKGVYEFLSSDQDVAALVRKFVSDSQLELLIKEGNMIIMGEGRGTFMWTIPLSIAPQFMAFIENSLESKGVIDWTLRSPGIQDVICSMYPNNQTSASASLTTSSPAGVMRKVESANSDDGSKYNHIDFENASKLSPSESIGINKTRSGNSDKFIYHNQLLQIFAVLTMRWKEFLHSSSLFFWTQMLLPFIVAFLIAIFCRDVSYPKLDLSSSSLNGVGEIGLSLGDYANSSDILHSWNRFLSRNNASLQENHIPADAYEWKEIKKGSSNSLWSQLQKEYYKHNKDRWASFVVEDIVPKWIESSVKLDSSAFGIPLDDVFAKLIAAQKEACPYPNPYADSGSKSISGSSYSGSNNNSEAGVNNNDAVSSKKVKIDKVKYIKNTISVCGDKPWLSISSYKPILKPDSSAPDNSSASDYDGFLVLSTYKSLRSNLTMLINVTSDHAAPVFFKESTPLLYDVFFSDDENNRNNLLGKRSAAPSLAHFNLYSHPFPEVNYNSVVYIERGYIGSTMIVLYTMIATTTIVRVVAELKRSRVKTLAQLGGLSSRTFWIANGIFDIFLVNVGLLSISIGILAGGPPISHYFFDFSTEFLKVPFFFPLCITFSFAIVFSSYFFTINSTDVLSSQLFILLTSVGCGLFMKIFLDRHNEPLYQLISDVLFYISPSYTFSSGIFEMFKWHAISMALSDQKILFEQYSSIYWFVLKCLLCNITQGFVYLLLIIIVESLFLKFRQKLGRWRRNLYSYTLSFCRIVPSYEINFFSKFCAYLFNNNSSCSTNRSSGSSNNDNDPSSTTNFNEKTALSFRSNKTLSFSANKNSSMSSLYGSIDATICNSNSNSNINNSSNANGKGKGSSRSLTSRGSVIRSLKDRSDVNIFPLLGEDIFLEDSSPSQNFLGGPEVAYIEEEDESRNLRKNNLSLASELSILSDYQYFQGASYNRLSANEKSNDFDDDDNILHMNKVCVEYDHMKKLALNRFCLDVKKGEKIALLGQSGGGKSTLFKTLSLAQNVPISGTVSIDNLDLIQKTSEICNKNIIGLVPQDEGLLDFLSVQDTIKLFCAIKLSTEDGKSSQTILDEEIRRFTDEFSGIISEKYLPYLSTSLSGGNKKRLSLAIAHLGYPDIMLLDEATSGVDPSAAERILNFLKIHFTLTNELTSSSSSLKKESTGLCQTLIFASHRIDECSLLCDRVLIVNEGKIRFDGSISSFNSILSKYYQVDIYSDDLSQNNSDLKVNEKGCCSRTSCVFDLLQLKLVERYPHIGGGGGGDDDRQSGLIDRSVEYSKSFFRITCDKFILPVSVMWNCLNELKISDKAISHFLFRDISMEEILSNIIDSFNDESRR